MSEENTAVFAWMIDRVETGTLGMCPQENIDEVPSHDGKSD
jgi:hypothetical protein